MQEVQKLVRLPIFLGLLSSLVIASLLAGQPAATADNPPRKILTGWIPYYSMKTALPAALNNIDLVDEVMPFWYTLKYDGKIKKAVITDLYAPANPSIPISQPLAAMRAAGLKIIPTITDGTAKLVLAKMLANPTQRAQVVDAIATMVRVNNYDGVDLDFEGFAFVDGNTSWKSTAPHWVSLVKELSAVLRAEKKLLSVSTPYVLDPKAAQKGYYVYAWADIAPFIDRLRIMTYDYSVARVGPIGPISWTERTLQYAVTIMPASKVFVGVPGYGRDWVTAVTGVCPANVANTVKAGAKAATFVMRDAAALAATYGATSMYDEKTGEVTFTYQKVYNGNTSSGLSTSCTATRTAWYQDARSWALRAALVSKYRIGGITSWTFGMEEPMAMESIRQIAKQVAPDQVNVTASTVANTVNYAEPFTISATFAKKDKSPLSSVPVRLEARAANETTWRTLATAITSQDGSVTRNVLLSKSAIVRFISDPTWERNAGISPEFSITVNRTISITPPASVKNGAPIQLAGSLRPRTASSEITVERNIAGVWKKIESSTTPVVTDSLGNFTVTIPAQPRGVLTLRISAVDPLWPLVSTQSFSIIIR